MKIMETNGITNLTPLGENSGWYWGTEATYGDLYEAEELFRSGHKLRGTRLLLLHHPDGRVVEPIKAREGQYFGRPVFHQGQIYLLAVDFPAEKICILRWDPDREGVERVTELPLSSVPDCYNLMLRAGEELLLVRQGSENRFQLLWPEKGDFPIGRRESFEFKEGDRLYFSRWEEDPEYREEAVIRAFPTGEVLEVLPGTIWDFPDGQHWLLR